MDANAKMEDLLDFSRPFNVALFEFTVRSFLDATSPQHQQAHGVIIALRESAHAWRCVDQILKESNNAAVRIVALQILEQTITVRWKLLPVEQQLGIRNYLTDKLISLCADTETMEREKSFIQRLNLTLIQVVKQEWPHNWPTLLQDLTNSARTSESLCENNMQLLQLLSEEVFEFSKEDMTQAKTKLLKETMNAQFEMVFQLCDMVLEFGTKPRLITTTLRTLLRFLQWIPIGFIFETPLIDRLLTRYLGVYQFRNDTLNCLSEIGSLVCEDKYNDRLVFLHNSVVTKLMSGMMPPEVKLAEQYDRVKEEDREFIHHLAMFFSGFYAVHLPQLERAGGETIALLQHGLGYLLNITEVDNPEVFKICLDAWSVLCADLYATESGPNSQHLVLHQQQQQLLFRQAMGGGGDEDDREDGEQGNSLLPVSHAPRNAVMSPRKAVYAAALSRLRYIMITRMAKPEEVLVKVESETGEVIREVTKDTDAIALYKQMRDTLVYLTHLDCDNTEDIMLKRLAEQCGETAMHNDSVFSSHAINTLSWAIGSISGTMDEQSEKQFLVAVIKDLLVLCEMKAGKDNKALIASDIMYVVGQYPRFLRNHWKFLKTVVAKLFEFMHELHPGVQDMACDTFMKLTLKCKRKFVQLQPGEDLPFIDHLLQNLPGITSDLETHQVHSFYESVGHILACHPDTNERTRYLAELMSAPNRRWTQLMQEASISLDRFHQEPAIREVIKIVRTNISVAKSTKHAFVPQLAQIHSDMMNVYKSYATFISQTVQMQGAQAAQHQQLRTMRQAKIEILTLLKTFVERSEDPQMVATRIVETLYVPILEDYSKSAPQARDAEVLDLFATIIAKLKTAMNAGVARILHYVFASTVQMICNNFEDFPDIRQHFYLLLKNLNQYCFPALWSAPPESQKQIVDTVIWGMRHTANDVQSMNLEFIEQLLSNIVGSTSGTVSQQFYRDHLLSITGATVQCLTDRLHKSGFKTHTHLLRQVFVLVCDGHVQVSLASASQNVTASSPGAASLLVAASPSENVSVLSQYVFKLLAESFPNSSQTAIRQFVTTLVDSRNAGTDVFKQNVRDFLITMKEFSGEDNKDLYREENEAAMEARRRAELAQRMQVGGLINPNADMNDL